MTEAEWLTGAKRNPMLLVFRDDVSERKMRLFACACVRRLWRWLEVDELRLAVDVAEKHAEGLATAQEMRDAGIAARRATSFEDNEGYLNFGYVEYLAVDELTGHDDNFWATVHGACERSSSEGGTSSEAGSGQKINEAEEAAQCKLLRDIFGNPFRPIILNPSWLTSTVLALTQGIYDDKAFDRMPILADALQDAGCDNAEILNHCREPGEHVKGCWVVDLLLDKK
jgi:hypothetical protein